jgi:hypothetical protein
MHCQPQRLIVQDAEIISHFGGCFRRGLLMNLPLNFIAVQNVAILGEIMVNCKLSHFLFLFLPSKNVRPLQGRLLHDLIACF